MKKTIIIAEAGVNHNGDIKIAKKLINEAANAGADYVKFQTFIAEECVSISAKKANYQIDKKNKTETQFEMIKKLEISYEDHIDLITHCNKKRIKFLSTAFDLKSIDFLKDKIDFYKIPSGEITNLLYLEKVAKLGLKVVMSTGMATMKEVKDALLVLIHNGLTKEDITILHCNTDYPTNMEDVNLRAMLSIQKEMNVKVGYSDHTLGIEVSIAAVAMGAQVIEKHFTLDRNMKGPDHKASLEPVELKHMITSIRNIEKSLGDGVKTPSRGEEKNIIIARKSIVAKQYIKKGDVFTNNNISVKRPGSGISPMLWYKILGTEAKKDYKIDDLI
tara:strand:+ start:369 stop:1364 length:996 start_codon:yes stop_codon:yes gene_type:complete